MMTLHAFTVFHVTLSLIGIFSGIVVVFGMVLSMRLKLVTALFLITTVLTSVTGFFFPYHWVTPAIIVGIVSLVVLLGAILARHTFHLAGNWRWIYVVCSVIALYLNVFVAVVQSFMKVPALHALAPTQSEPPFKIAQLTVLVIFLILGVLAVRKFHPAPVPEP